MLSKYIEQVLIENRFLKHQFIVRVIKEVAFFAKNYLINKELSNHLATAN